MQKLRRTITWGFLQSLATGRDRTNLQVKFSGGFS
jgi:hypothetical protein